MTKRIIPILCLITVLAAITPVAAQNGDMMPIKIKKPGQQPQSQKLPPPITVEATAITDGPAPAPLQAGHITFYFDGAATVSTSCEPAGLQIVYVFAEGFTEPITGVQFKVEEVAPFTDFVYMSDEAIYPVTIGQSNLGVVIGFGTAIDASTPVHILTINYVNATGCLSCSDNHA
ncbi:MAG: hypothetical protein JSW50_15295, partial [Candidatus Latescibacterota bacterium]